MRFRKVSLSSSFKVKKIIVLRRGLGQTSNYYFKFFDRTKTVIKK
jgi:hypothetical protein